MLFKVQNAGKIRYIKLNGASYSTFLRQAKEKFDIPDETNVYLMDKTGTEVDEDVFSNVLEEKSDIVWTLADASSVNESPVQSSCTDTLSLSSRSSDSEPSFMTPKRQCIDSTSMMSPRRDSSDDIFLQAKEEHFFDSKSNEGYIAWKLKNMQRELSSGSSSRSSSSPSSREPSSKRGPQFARSVTAEHQLEGDQCREAISLLRHTTDERQILLKIEQTFQYRQALIHDSQKCDTLLSVFPRFLDTKGLVLRDFQMMFGEEISSKLMEKWGTSLKQKVIKEANNLTRTPMLESLLQSAEENPEDNEESSESAWDSDMAALLLLVYLLPPPPSGKKRAVKMTVREALSHVVQFHKSCRNLQETTRSVHGKQPYILAVGTSRHIINDYYIVVDSHIIPCKAKSSISAFDELFKAHYVFGICYDQALHNMYTFVQTTI
ncbi:hypothetical protein AMECASPLE_009705 [Ameca splendens]|uniref:Uncharacterized protein n=1 Tax=Ameca splendens TaxID=208324 RepID=A0ABV1A8Q8_9TELE